MVVYSPSNMSTYMQCPRKFQAQCITKEITWQESKQKNRGIQVHDSFRRAVMDGWDSVKEFPDGINQDFSKQRVNTIRALMASGASCYTEYEMVLDRKLKSSSWWDDEAYIRCKADVVIVPPSSDRLCILDWKTGKHWDDIDFQLRVEAFVSYFIFQRPIVQYSYLYVDDGSVQSGVMDFRNGTDCVKDIVQLIKQLDQAQINNDFPSVKNRFCKWCGLYHTEGCK